MYDLIPRESGRSQKKSQVSADADFANTKRIVLRAIIILAIKAQKVG